MSTIIMSACWPLQMPSSQKAVLISLADNANDEGACWPSVERIAERTCLTDRTVQKCLKWLEERGAIGRQKRHKRSAVYTVTPGNYQKWRQEEVRPEDSSGENSSGEGFSGEDFSPENGVHLDRKTTTFRPENPSPRTIKEPKEEPSSKSSPRPPEGASGRGPKKNPVSFKTFVDACHASGVKVIGDYQPVLDYCERAKLPAEFVNLCWAEFKRRHLPGGTAEGKRYTDWRRAFLNCVQGNWYGIWFADKGTGAFALTTKGVQAENVIKGADQ